MHEATHAMSVAETILTKVILHIVDLLPSMAVYLFLAVFSRSISTDSIGDS